MNYLYELKVYIADDDLDPIDEICHISGATEESLLEQLRKVDHAKKEYEEKAEFEAQAEIDRQKEEEAEKDNL